MMAIKMQFNPMDKARLFALMARFPKETYRGLGRAAAIVRSRMRKVMRQGGGEGVGKFAVWNWVTASTKFGKLGGKLAESSAIQMYRDGKAAFTIGFVTALWPWARMFQEPESRDFEDGEKLRFKMRFGLVGIPDRYERPARNMVEPFAKHYQREFLQWALKNTEKILAGKRA